MSGILYLVAISIGNDADLTLRARRTLEEVDLIVCEEYRESQKYLDRLKIKKELFRLSEHDEDKASKQVVKYLLDGQNIALISDTGTPVLADLGSLLITRAIEACIQIVPIPGPASPIAALLSSGFPIHKWYYRGFLSPKKEIRQCELAELRTETLTTILMEAPYRLAQLLSDMSDMLGSDRQIALCWQLTMPDELILRGSIRDVMDQINRLKLDKGEFVLVVSGKSDAFEEISEND